MMKLVSSQPLIDSIFFNCTYIIWLEKTVTSAASVARCKALHRMHMTYSALFYG